ncbi:MAG: transcription antitermination factor NusB [Planctomycetota bacterium]|jgi:16S rRNA (cytosine967-C5)-methyltransferase
MMAADARTIAVKALRDRGGNVTAALRRLLAQHELAPADRGLARELALGVVRRRGTLETVIKAFLKRPGQQVQSPIQEILLVALYQILFCQRIPDFAAVNEAVERTVAAGRHGQRGFVNAVLRGIARAIGPVEEGTVPRARNTIPVGPRMFRVLDREVFADPKAEPVEYLAGAYSLPAELGRRWLSQAGGELQPVIAWATHANIPAPLIARVNRMKASVDQTLAALGEQEVEAVRHANGQSVVFTDYCDVTALTAFRNGWIQPQDASATDVILACDVGPGKTVLDFCAAPGTKTTHLADRMGDQGQIVALDVSDDKLQRITDNCSRMGFGCVRTVAAERLGELPLGEFDLVLADVPCSNTGVLSRRAEARWRFGSKSLGRLIGDQKAILAAAVQFVRRGGQLVYSTCSLEVEECHDMANFAAERLGVSLVSEKLTRPGGVGDPAQWRDGGYYAIFRRR